MKSNNTLKCLVDVIIPTYNCSQFICRAIDSVLDQNANIIVIDDASTDNTYNTIKKYLKFSNFKVFRNRRNRKLGASRNVGIKKANSKYVMFLDADDWLAEDAIKIMLEEAEKNDADIVAAGVERVDEEGKYYPYYSHKFICYNRDDALERFSRYELTAPAWAKLYSRQFLNENYITFPERYWHEDIIFTFMVAIYCKKYISINNYLYSYYVNCNSIINSTPTQLHLESYFFVYKKLLQLISYIKRMGIGNDGLYQKIIHNYFTAEFTPRFRHYLEIHKREKFKNDLFLTAKKILGINGMMLADIIYTNSV